MSDDVGYLRRAANEARAIHPDELAPAIAEAAADILDRAAVQLERHLPHWGSHPGGIDEPPIVRAPEDTAAIVEHHFGSSLKLARAILGDQP